MSTVVNESPATEMKDRFAYSPGLEGVIAGESALCLVDEGEAGAGEVAGADEVVAGGAAGVADLDEQEGLLGKTEPFLAAALVVSVGAGAGIKFVEDVGVFTRREPKAVDVAG